MSDAAATMDAESPQRRYRPAPGSRGGSTLVRSIFQLARFTGSDCVYFGDDHLLVLKRALDGVAAHRIAYADIRGIRQAPNPCQRNAYLAWFFVLLLAVLCVLLASIPAMVNVALTWGGLLFLLAVAGLGSNALYGPTCTVTILTATGAETLTGLTRARHADAAIAELIQHVALAQGELPEDSRERPAEAWRAVDHPKPALAHRYAVDSAVQPSNSVTPHTAFYVLLLIMSASLLLDLQFRSEAKNLLDMVLYAGSLLLGCYAVARQRQSIISEGLKRFTLVTLFVQALFIYVVTFSTVFIFSFSEAPPEDWPAFTTGIDFSQAEFAMLLPLLYVEIVWHALPGLLGLLFTLAYRMRRGRIAQARDFDAAARNDTRS